jgi:hypothetical protein
MQHAIDELQNDTDISVRKPERKVSGGAPKRTSDIIKTDLIVHVDGVRLCLSIAATDGPVVRPQMIYERGEPRLNDIDRRKLTNSEENLS